MSPEAKKFIDAYDYLMLCNPHPSEVEDLVKSTPDHVLEEVFGV